MAKPILTLNIIYKHETKSPVPQVPTPPTSRAPPPLPQTKPPKILKIKPQSKADIIKKKFHLEHVNTTRCMKFPMDKLTPDERKFKYEYNLFLRDSPATQQNHADMFEDMIEEGIFPLPVHGCKYCLCCREGEEHKEMSQLIQDTLQCNKTSPIKVKQFMEYRQRAIDSYYRSDS